jgi:hypothetical protein
VTVNNTYTPESAKKMRDKFAGTEHWQLAKKHSAADNMA